MSVETFSGFTKEQILNDLDAPGQDTTWHPIIRSLFERIEHLENELEAERWDHFDRRDDN